MNAWRGPRHQSWAKDTNVATVMFVVIFATYIIWEIVGTAPQGLVSILGIAGGAWFGAVSGDKKKKDADTQATAHRAEEKAERAEQLASSESARADRAEARESEPSLHTEDGANHD